MQVFSKVSRIFLAILFLFSGFVKGVDPLGTAYKIEDYLLAYQLDFLFSLSLFFAFALIAFELSLGIFLLFNLLPKYTWRASALLMVFFTFVTLYDALYNPVPDCGCFGDALILTNWETFYKNLVIDGFLVIALFEVRKPIKIKTHLLWALLIYFAFVAFSYYNLKHLPLVDFRSWKKGNQIFNPDQKPIDIYLSYKNIHTGETQEFLSPNYPYQDTAWLAEWEFQDSREFNPNPPASIMLFDLDSEEVTNEVLGFPDKSLLIVSYSLNQLSNNQILAIKNTIQLAESESIPVYLITASIANQINVFTKNNSIDIPFFMADDIDLKTIVRSNPGLILLENGYVRNKWSVVDFPTQAAQFSD